MDIEERLRFAKTISGVFDNLAQSQDNPKDFARINIIFRPLPWKIFNGPGFYSEQHYDYAPWEPYRQGVHKLTFSDNTFVVKNFGFKKMNRLAGAGRNPELLALLEGKDLDQRCGCAMHFSEIKRGFYQGYVEPGKKCLVPRNGLLTYLVSEVEINEDTWVSRDRGFDPETDEVKWGSEHGPLCFDRIEDFSEAIDHQWIQEQ